MKWNLFIKIHLRLTINVRSALQLQAGLTLAQKCLILTLLYNTSCVSSKLICGVVTIGVEHKFPSAVFIGELVKGAFTATHRPTRVDTLTNEVAFFFAHTSGDRKRSSQYSDGV